MSRKPAAETQQEDVVTPLEIAKAVRRSRRTVYRWLADDEAMVALLPTLATLHEYPRGAVVGWLRRLGFTRAAEKIAGGQPKKQRASQ